ncbi:embryonic protein UVS.2-like [Bufo bufo]|uniref:embryonic protein UVS.2-like n=1 Tax=Bufo bufo TaxID=8384 RepID=UPI001ABE0E5E|nr:embryonic protein UVS.2-like [Bufo bufo]
MGVIFLLLLLMADFHLKVVTSNVNSIRARKTRHAVYEHLRYLKADVFFLQETRLNTSGLIREAEREWQSGPSFWSMSVEPYAGVSILFNTHDGGRRPKFTYTCAGRSSRIDLALNQLDRVDFYENMADWWEDVKEEIRSLLQRLSVKKGKSQGPTSSPPSEDVFSTIERMNKGSKKSLYQGDIAVKEGRSAITCTTGNCFWPKASNGLVSIPYTLDPQFTSIDRNVIAKAMLEFSTLTCINFVPRTKEADYLNVISDVGCYSSLGRVGGPQDVSLDRNGCVLHGVVQHEFNHAVGFQHEHSRSDRDSYVKILWQNIVPGYNASFAKANTNNLGLEYDYSSVMHYGKYSFASNNYGQTIQPIPNNNVDIGQRIGLSSLDVAKINRLYNCNVCSSVLSSNSGVFFSASNPSNYPNNYNCSWLIRIPNNQVLLQFKAFDVQSTPGCTADYIRVFDGPSRASPLLLDRSCGTGQLPSLVSSDTTMLVEFVTDSSFNATGFRASYSTVNCGGTFTAPIGIISSPGYDQQQMYPPLSDCTWTILAPVGYRVQLAFADFSLEASTPCSYDSLEIRDGMLSTSPLLGNAYCGTTTIQPLSSTNNALLLHFQSDGSVESTGFQAKYYFGKSYHRYRPVILWNLLLFFRSVEKLGARGRSGRAECSRTSRIGSDVQEASPPLPRRAPHPRSLREAAADHTPASALQELGRRLPRLELAAELCHAVTMPH